jgi:hypothetical protein
VHDRIGTFDGREKKNHQNAQNSQYSQVTSCAAKSHSTYYIAAVDLTDQSGNIGAAPVTKPERLFIPILLALSYPVYLVLGLRKEFPANVSDAIPVPPK